jgi:hypothetical protein
MNVKTTTIRTQGNAAFEVINAPILMTLTSQPVTSTATALKGIGHKGAVLQLDVLLPAENSIFSPSKGKTDPANEGAIEGFVTSKSRGLNQLSIGHVLFKKFRTGIYNTISFNVPADISSALERGGYNDLVFEFVVASPSLVPGSYLFDNLRVHSVELVQTPTGAAPPANYGGSVDLVVAGSKPVVQTYSIDPTQIPAGFHLKKGTVGSSSVQFELGLDGKPELTCTYVLDPTDKTDESYKLQSCTNGYAAGDIVNANWTSLEIVGGLATQQVDAQLVLSPLGDITGSGLLPAMPTFWGASNTCTPAPTVGKVVTKSTTCSSQVAQANSIITNYFNQVNADKPDGALIVAPVPEFATRHGDIIPINTVTGKPLVETGKANDEVEPEATPANDSTFNTGGDLNPGGSFDAYWKLSGNLEPSAVAGTDENLTHFDATFTTHGVLFGDDIDVVDAKLTADTDSGETTPAYKAATSTGTLGFYVFGEEIPSNGFTFSPSTGFSIDPNWSQEYDLPSIQVWIFDITLGALVEADFKASASAALTGADLSITPTASLGGHISGGINLGIASGSVDAKVNLITLSAPMTAQAKLVLNTDPLICATQLSGSLQGNLNVSSGGGEVDLDATFGICPFCYSDSYRLFKWGALASRSFNLFNDTLSYQAFGLPASLCPLATTVNIIAPTAGATLSSNVPTAISGLAAPTETSLPYTSTYQWSFTPGANASTATINPAGATSATPVVTFGAPKSGNTSTWTVNLTATTTVNSQGGTVLTKTATATPVTITVTTAKPGDFITQVLTTYNGPAVPDPSGFLNVGNAPGALTFNGAVVDATGTLNTTFTVVECNDQTVACTSPVAAPFGTVTPSGATTTTPSATWNGFSGGFFKVTMTTTQNGTPFSSASVVIYGTVLI